MDINNGLLSSFLDAADVRALGEIFLDERIDDKYGDDGAYDQGVNDRIRCVYLVPTCHGFGIRELLKSDG
jgi:hypothetical protein